MHLNGDYNEMWVGKDLNKSNKCFFILDTLFQAHLSFCNIFSLSIWLVFVFLILFAVFVFLCLLD